MSAQPAAARCTAAGSMTPRAATVAGLQLHPPAFSHARTSASASLTLRTIVHAYATRSTNPKHMQRPCAGITAPTNYAPTTRGTFHQPRTRVAPNVRGRLRPHRLCSSRTRTTASSPPASRTIAHGWDQDKDKFAVGGHGMLDGRR
ncbi:hypothetical protein FIBSPDRAFT_967530 [Athelia psychrophila]|uniref:Uncharacterized protein n=1 Tax=Athelia psychrophila TaxID=1759441 RepID=A0A167VM57_9AGAM|nr:hypothetical protein FIBSPDRAFT_967530 [Fibularhizoctonia sp. CBS 109695]